MKRIWNKLWLAGVLTAALALSACSGGKEAQTVTNAAADGVLTVGILPGNDIYSTKVGENFEGIEPELIKQLGADLGAAVEFQEAASLEELLESLSSGQVDMAVGRIAQSDEYSQSYQVSRTYAKGGICLLTRKNDFTDTLAGYAETTVGISGTIPSSVRADIPYMDQVTIQEYEDLASGVADLKDEAISALVVTEREALAEIADRQLQAQELLNGPRESYVVLMGAGQTELASSLNQIISQYLDDQASGGTSEQEETLPASNGEEE